MVPAGEWSTWLRRPGYWENSHIPVGMNSQSGSDRPECLSCHNTSVLLPPASFGDGNEMVVVDVKYDEYALVHVVNTKEEHLTVVAKLYGKTVL